MYLVGLHIYCKMIHGPYNIKYLHTFIQKCWSTDLKARYFTKTGELLCNDIQSETANFDYLSPVADCIANTVMTLHSLKRSGISWPTERLSDSHIVLFHAFQDPSNNLSSKISLRRTAISTVMSEIRKGKQAITLNIEMTRYTT